MAWIKQGRKKRNIKRMRKLKWEESGLGAPAIKWPAVLIEEIRRQGMVLASRGVGQAARAAKPAGQDAISDRTTHRRRRGATG
jgi:hypothetical protein